jgi:hypothetical protein
MERRGRREERVLDLAFVGCYRDNTKGGERGGRQLSTGFRF